MFKAAKELAGCCIYDLEKRYFMKKHDLRASKKLVGFLALMLFAGGGGFLIPVWFMPPNRGVYLVIATMVCLPCFPALILVSRRLVCGSFSPFLSLTLRENPHPAAGVAPSCG